MHRSAVARRAPPRPVPDRGARGRSAGEGPIGGAAPPVPRRARLSERLDPVRPVLRAIGRLATRRPGLVLAALGVSWAMSMYLASGLEVRASFIELLPEDARPSLELREVLAHSRTTSDVVVAIPADDRALAERFARTLITRLEADSAIDMVSGYVDPSWFRDHQLLYADEADLDRLVTDTQAAIDHEIEIRSPFYIDLEDEPGPSASTLIDEVGQHDEQLPIDEWVVTRDGRYLAIWVFFASPSGDLDEAQRSWDRVRSAVDALRGTDGFPDDFDVRYAGGVPTRVDEQHALVSDLSVAGTLGFLGVVLLIVLALRAPRALVLLAVPLGTGLGWTFAFARLAVGHLNIISGFLFSILSGIGIEYGIHLLHAYRERRERGEELVPSVESLVETTGRALFSGALTNASVFGIIAFANFRGFSEFGYISAVGLLLTLVSTLLGMPALLVLSERWRPMKFPAPKEGDQRGVHVPRPLRTAVIVLVPALALASLVLVARGDVRFDGDWRVLVGDTETTRFGEYLRSQLAGTYDAAIVWVADDDALDEVAAAAEDVRAARAARGETFDVIEVRTLRSLVPPIERQRARAERAVLLGAQLDRIHPEWLESDAQRDELERARRIVAASTPFTDADVPNIAIASYRTADGEGTMAYLEAEDTARTETSGLVAWADQARELVAAFDARHLRVATLSQNWVAGEVFERIQGDGRFLLAGTLIVVFLVLLLDLRRPLTALSVLGAVLLGVIAMAGGMWVTGVRLNFMNAAILPVCIGISLDNAIHVVHRWREEGPGSIPIVLRHTTLANALSSATNLLGFGALAITSHGGLQSVAWLATIGVALTYVSTTLWFPLVLAAIDDRRKPAEKS
jgi:predicted RND superfamily exporter protein